MVSIIALWVLVLFETVLLLLLLRALGELKQKGVLSVDQGQSPEHWGLAVGEPAPSFAATDYDGKVVRLEDFQGQRLILAFVSPECSACAGTIIALNAVLQNEPDLAVLVMGGTDPERNRSYAVEHTAQMPILTPVPPLAKEAYRIRGVPFVFVLDENGVIRVKGTVNHFEHLQALLQRAFELTAGSR